MLLPLALAWLGACAMQPSAPPAGIAAPAAAKVRPPSARGTAQMQVHRDWVFKADGVTFSNRLESARLNGVERLGTNRYAVTIAPESRPINPSPWYGFSIVADSPRTLGVEFRYRHGRQRYTPKLSSDGVHWREATAEEFAKSADGGATLTVAVGPRPLRVFAQPPIGLDDFLHWETALGLRIPVRAGVVGHSVQGRPLRMLTFGNVASKRVLVVLGRQHPPETTGSQALMGFVDRLAADTPLARRFRDEVFVVVVPVMNPDGVVEGNWRGNADGKDLNRDWGTFTEPETRAVRDALVRRIDGAGRSLAFAIDFHSTWSDVFYTVNEDPSRAPGGVLRQWMDSMQQRYPGRIREKANAAKTTVFKNWAFNTFHAPTVTYEVGDRTGAAQLGELADFAADRLMRLLARPEKE
jgi:hypothetical protein